MNSKVNIVDEFLSQEDLDSMKLYVISRKNGIIRDSKLTDYIWQKYKFKFLEFDSNITELFDYVTITNSNSPIILHQDVKHRNNKWKILIYLNQIEDGGTIFMINDEEYLVENKPNRLVFFDIELFHKSQKFESKDKNKLCIGFRAKSL